MSVARPFIVDDDDGTGQEGTRLDAAFFNSVFDYIDAKVEEATAAAAHSLDAEALMEVVAALSNERDLMRGLVEAGLTGWSHEDLAVAKKLCGWKDDEAEASIAEDWPCTFSYHTHKDRAEAAECAKKRR